jgi:tetratricopeptide (TPR) repeat protein
MLHNLPNQPYKKFFGRTDAINKINDDLIEGGTYIASIDGVGGIGKTALTYYFCKEILIKKGVYNYLVWITAKDTVFDAVSSSIKRVENDFKNNSIEALINETIKVTGFNEVLLESFEEKKMFFEDIVKSEKIFFVFDNLETIQDETFFDYLKEFNKFSRHNRDLKILTTSRKRKKIADFPIEIEGLSMADALAMLEYLGHSFIEKPIKSITSASEFQKIKIVEKVGGIPLGIEFIVGQLAIGKGLGQIYQELEGYPSLEGIEDEEEKRQRLSDIIAFSFKDMYETLDANHQLVFKVIAAIQKNKRKYDKDISFDLLMNMTNFNKGQLEIILENLLENKLIFSTNKDEYNISPMAINFTKQYFEDFGEIEENVISVRDAIVRNTIVQDNIDLFIERVHTLTNNLQFTEAETLLLNAIEKNEDHRLYFELGKTQAVLKKNSKASDNFKRATELATNNKNVWFEWINLERSRIGIALSIANNALEATNFDVSIAMQTLDIYKFRKEYENMREFAKAILQRFGNSNRNDDCLKFLYHWKSVEYLIFRDKADSRYLDVVEKLISIEPEKESVLELLKEELSVCNKLSLKEKANDLKDKITRLEQKIKLSIGYYVKQMNFYMSGHTRDTEKAKGEAKKILTFADSRDIEHRKNALRVLLQILATEQDYERIILTFEEYSQIALQDRNCVDVYTKAKKDKLKKQMDALIAEISQNLMNSENNLRSIIMSMFGNNEVDFISFIRAKSMTFPIDWVTNWQTNRNKSLKNDLPLIYYSDFSNLRRMLDWVDDSHLRRANPRINTFESRNKVKKLSENLKFYTIDERNETFHARVLQYDLNKLNEILVDTGRLFNLTSEVISELTP